MKIYTKTGDSGDTSLFGGRRVPKDSLRVELYGTIDETNSILGLARASSAPPEVERVLAGIQHQLFVLGADLATPLEGTQKHVPRIGQQEVEQVERLIDDIDPIVPSLERFILPGGSVCASHLHHARTVCRRTERLAVRLSKSETVGKFPLIYLNRLSDLLFVLARYANFLTNTPEIEWKSSRGE